MEVFILVIIGLAVGSFISAVSYRHPKDIDFVKGRSFCDHCKKKLAWFDNLPLLSFLIYKGRSRCCKTKISFRYPLIELFSMFGIIVIYLLTFNFIFIFLFLILLTVFIIDFENQIIPDNFNWLILITGLLYFPTFEKIFTAFFLSFLILLIHLLTKGKGMGLGDVKLALGLGIWLNLSQGVNFLLASFLTGGLVAIILLLSGKAKMKTKIAFGPFLVIGFLITLLFMV